MHQVKRLECKSIDPLYTSHEFPKQYVHIMGQNAHVFFTILCPDHVWPSCFGLLYWHVMTSDWKGLLIAGKIIPLLTNGGNVLTGACFDSGLRHECQMFAWMISNGSVSNHALKKMKKRTFHDVQCIVMCFLVQTATRKFSKNYFKRAEEIITL